MGKCNVFFEYDWDHHEDAFIMKGYREDIYVEIAQKFYHLNFYIILDVIQDMKHTMDWKMPYFTPNNLILVEDVSFKSILDCVANLFECGYFEQTKSIDVSTKVLHLIGSTN